MSEVIPVVAIKIGNIHVIYEKTETLKVCFSAQALIKVAK